MTRVSADPGALGATVRWLRDGETQQQLAERAGLPLSTVQRVERGIGVERTVLARLDALAAAFDLPHSGYLLAPSPLAERDERDDVWWAYARLSTARKRRVQLLIATLSADERVTGAELCAECPAHTWWLGEPDGSGPARVACRPPRGSGGADELVALHVAAAAGRTSVPRLRALCERGELAYELDARGVVRVRRGDVLRLRWPEWLQAIAEPTVAQVIEAYVAELRPWPQEHHRPVLASSFAAIADRPAAELDAWEAARGRKAAAARHARGARIVERFVLWAAKLELVRVRSTSIHQLRAMLSHAPDRPRAEWRAELPALGPQPLAPARLDPERPPTLRLAINAYLAALSGAKRADGTLSNRRVTLGEFATLLPDDQALAEISADMLDRWTAGLRGRGLKDSTVKVKRNDVSAFLAWCERRQLIAVSPMRHTLALSLASSVDDEYPELADDELRRLLEHARYAPGRPAERQLEDYLLCALMALAGLRVSEVCGLDAGDVSAERIVVRHGKGDRRRSVPTDDELWAALEQHAAPGPHLFGMATSPATRISRNAIEVRVAQLARAAGLGHVHPHVLRHSFASRVARQPGAMQPLRDMLGHRSIDTTSRYMRSHLAERRAAIVAARLQVSPRAAS